MLSTRLRRVLEHMQERSVTILTSTHTGPYSFKPGVVNREKSISEINRYSRYQSISIADCYLLISVTDNNRTHRKKKYIDFYRLSKVDNNR